MRILSSRFLSRLPPGKFTFYDIWVSGLSPQLFPVVKKVDIATWDTLLSSTMCGWDMCEDPDENTAVLYKNMSS